MAVFGSYQSSLIEKSLCKNIGTQFEIFTFVIECSVSIHFIKTIVSYFIGYSYKLLHISSINSSMLNFIPLSIERKTTSLICSSSFFANSFNSWVFDDVTIKLIIALYNYKKYLFRIRFSLQHFKILNIASHPVY